MRTKQQFIKDGLILTATTLILRTCGVFFSALLAKKAGTAVTGLYTQILSVYTFAVAAAAAGVNLGALRITSESYGSGSFSEIRTGFSYCKDYCLTVGTSVAILLFICSDFLGTYILCDNRTVNSLRALSFALPFISLSNAFHGYFNGVNKIYKSAFVNLTEQIIRICLTIFALDFFKTNETEKLCFILVACNALAEITSCVILSIFYFFDSKRFPKSSYKCNDLKKKFIGITLPLACSALVRSGLTTAEHIFIPIGLRAYGANTDSALSEYGLISGMALPLMLYPMALMNAFASVSVSELSARVSAGENRNELTYKVSKGIGFTLIYSIFCAVIMRYFAYELGISVYDSEKAGKYLSILAPCIILMYLDHISDGMLKGLDKQNYVMKVNIADAALSVLFAIVLVPKYGPYGFIASIYICEFLNCACSFGMLMYITGLKCSIIEYIIVPTIISITSVKIFGNCVANIKMTFISISLCTAVYFLSLYLIRQLFSFLNKQHTSLKHQHSFGDCLRQ